MKHACQKRWAVFEVMIALMTPEGFAALMSTTWPELVGAMPFGIGKITRLMGKMPELMPRVMDNLMPHMIGDVVPLVVEPMVDYLRGNEGKKTGK